MGTKATGEWILISWVDQPRSKRDLAEAIGCTPSMSAPLNELLKYSLWKCFGHSRSTECFGRCTASGNTRCRNLFVVRLQELASDIRFHMWQGLIWNQECYRNPVNKLLGQLDLEKLCQESHMHSLPAALAAKVAARAFTQSLLEGKHSLIDTIIDYSTYLGIYGDKLAHAPDVELSDWLLPLVIQTNVSDL